MLSNEDKYYLKEAMPFIGCFILVNIILIGIVFPEIINTAIGELVIRVMLIFGINLLVIGVLRLIYLAS